MFNFFKSKKENGKRPQLPQLFDLNDNQINVGDKVKSLRYELGESELIIEEDQYYYKSLASGKKVSWLKMVDAITEKQKVKKIINQ